MTDEEKKAIKDCDIIFINLEDMLSEESANDYRNSYKILKNLIEKQQKEIEKLKFNNHMVKKWNEQLDKNCISKDKIKEKIEEQRQKYFDIHDGKHSINEICFESTKVEGAVEVLKELLKEN